ncbi:hypothetical protein Tco_0823279 [Tanacetum coccineum]|uniref:Uncharacterized protein n=1 Tax=Tanacetum coccineum TaxID=301880 RepID=A0ABQ5AHH1_9ASTR
MNITYAQRYIKFLALLPSSEVVEMENPDITMKEYIQLETKKSLRRGQVYNWETATYGKVGYFEDIDYFKIYETEFPAIVYKEALTSEQEVSSEPTENDDDKINVELSSEDISTKPLDSVLDVDVDTYSRAFDENFETNHDRLRRPRNLRHAWLRFEGQDYTNADIQDFEDRLGRIHDRQELVDVATGGAPLVDPEIAQGGSAAMEASQMPQAAALAPRRVGDRVQRLEEEVYRLGEILVQKGALIDRMSTDVQVCYLDD